MTAELRIRAGTDEDTDRLLELVKLSLGEGLIPRDRAYWSWKHHCNPFGRSPILVAESEGELVGLRVFMRWQWSVNGSTIDAVRAVDTATHPDWQGKGIFSRLTRALLVQVEEAGVALVFNTPNQKSRPGYLKMGWSSLGRTSLWIRPLRALSMLRSWAGSAHGASVGEVASAVPFASARSTLSDIPLDDFLDDLERHDGRFATLLSAEYLQWRYADPPGFQYYAAWNGDPRDGVLLIFRFKTRGRLRELRFAEVLISPTRKARRLGGALLRHVLRGADTDYAVAMASAGTPELRALARTRFLPAPRLGPILTVRPLNPAPHGTDPLRRASWRLSTGDLELF